jgi:uncharacterized DUF497 family protein
MVRFEWDELKNQRNIRERGIPFGRAADFDFETALFVIDSRKDYGETRIRALGFIGERLHALVFAARGEKIRVISLRKASKREERKYAQSRSTEPAEDRS